jgi:hypothetical protein
MDGWLGRRDFLKDRIEESGREIANRALLAGQFLFHPLR